ncbi:cupin domain-containing protein [Microbulbifer hainanensis]|uniref:cupin domain-containing protein n=1 Tax=Microbulbifer hainanensis TaxID=2735675 RepID=UPI0018690D2D|nr:cupin domain-containing protein [Microbulbifer hainanensis]
MKNLFSAIPDDLSAEVFEDLVSSQSVRIERIISRGHTTPEQDWYDQDENEWVVVLQGAARILFADGSEESLGAGDFVSIPAHSRHRVSWTDPDQITIWLAVFYR